MRFRNKMTKRFQKCICLLFAVLVLSFTTSVAVNAQGEVYYGSESYSPEINSEFPVGVYISSDEIIASYHVILTYDSSKLQLISGAQAIDENHLEISGTGSLQSYRARLVFSVLEGGNSTLTVDSVKLYADAEETREIRATEVTDAVPVTVAIPTSNQLDYILINGRSLAGFNSATSDYYFSVNNSVTNLDITADSINTYSTVEISSTALEVGLNDISIRVSNNGSTSTYHLYVTREEPVTPVDPEPEKEPEPEGISGVARIILGLIVLAGVAAIVVMITIINNQKKNNKKEDLTDALEHASDVVLEDIVKEGLEGLDLEEAEETEEDDENKPIISLKDVCMYFKVSQSGSDSLKEFLIRTLQGKNKFRTLKALDHISFDVHKGEVVGVIGSNGSGKSTTLKIVTGALNATSGVVDVDQSKVQLLTLGTGFDMELTAKENVYLNGALIGYDKEYIDEHYDAIVEFAELDGFMDERVKNFSSGMVSRLGFAIATMRDAPEILILDEVLSVGDMFFRKKSMKRVKEMIHGGSTVLIVSHSASVIRENCSRAIWIEKGKMMADGDPRTVCDLYEHQEEYKK